MPLPNGHFRTLLNCHPGLHRLCVRQRRRVDRGGGGRSEYGGGRGESRRKRSSFVQLRSPLGTQGLDKFNDANIGNNSLCWQDVSTQVHVLIKLVIIKCRSRFMNLWTFPTEDDGQVKLH